MADKGFIATPVDNYYGGGNPDNLAGTGGATNSFVPEAEAPTGGMIPFKGLEPIPEASPSGINVVSPVVKGPGGGA